MASKRLQSPKAVETSSKSPSPQAPSPPAQSPSPSTSPSPVPSPSTSPSPTASSGTVRSRPLRVLKNIVDRLDRNQREMVANYQTIRQEWENVIRTLKVDDTTEQPPEPAAPAVPPILRSRAEAEHRRSEVSEATSAGTAVDDPEQGPRSGSKTTAAAPKKRVKKNPGEGGGGQRQDPERNAVERQIRLLAKLQKNLAEKQDAGPPPIVQKGQDKGWHSWTQKGQDKGWHSWQPKGQDKGWHGWQPKGHGHDKGWSATSKDHSSTGKSGKAPASGQWSGWWGSSWGVQPERSSSSGAWDIVPPPSNGGDGQKGDPETASSGSKGYWWYVRKLEKRKDKVGRGLFC